MSRLIKLRLGLAAIIPYELAKKLGLEEGQEVIVKESKFGLFINPLKEREKEETSPGQESRFTRDELEVANKLLSMKFADRTPENMDKKLSSFERKVLEKLIENKAVNIFKSQKYKDGVYNIKDKTYEIIRKQLTEKSTEKLTEKLKEVKEENKIEIKSSKPTEKYVERPSEKSAEKLKELEAIREIETEPLKVLERQGYVVIEDQNSARRISDEIASRGKKRDVVGIRGFDKRYYVLKTSFYLKNQPKVRSSLNGGKKTIEQISSESGLEKQICTGILAIMNDNSEVIEKRKGVFILAE